MEVKKISVLEHDNKENIPPFSTSKKPGPNDEKGQSTLVKINGKRRPLRDVSNFYKAAGAELRLPSSVLVSGFSSSRKRKVVDDCAEQRPCSKILRREHTIQTETKRRDTKHKQKQRYGTESIVSERTKLIVSLLILQLCFAGFNIVSRVALNLGVSKIVYPTYRNIIALLLIGPFAYFMEKKDRTPLTFSLLVEFFLLALVGITANQVYYILGIYYTSPTFVSAMQNTVPALTFVMASALRIEQVNVTRMDGLVKILGTLASIGGAMVITLYKGPPILNGTNSSRESMVTLSSKMQSWTWGCVFTFCHCLSWAGWMVIQAPIVKKYPAKLSLTSFTLFFGLLQFLCIAAFTERDPTHWQIGSGEEIFTILYAGIISSGLVIALQTWCIQKGGPVFVASFQPVQTVLVAGMASIVLGDRLYSGGVIGATLIMIGLYLVLWGKRAEARYQSQGEEETLTKHLLEGTNSSQECPTRVDIP